MSGWVFFGGHWSSCLSDIVVVGKRLDTPSSSVSYSPFTLRSCSQPCTAFVWQLCLFFSVWRWHLWEGKIKSYSVLFWWSWKSCQSSLIQEVSLSLAQPYWLYRGRHTFSCEILASLSCLQLLTFIIVILVYFDFIHLPESFSPMLETTPLISYLTGQIELL